MKKQNILKIIASALSVCVAAGISPAAVSAAGYSLTEEIGYIDIPKPGANEYEKPKTEDPAAQSDGFSGEGYSEGGALGSDGLNIADYITEKIHYTVGEGNIYFAPAEEEGGSAFLRLENIPFVESYGFEFAYNIESPLIIEAVGVNTGVSFSQEVDFDVTLTGSGELNNFTLLSLTPKINMDGFAGKLNAMIGIYNFDEEIPRLDATVYGKYVYTSGAQISIGDLGTGLFTLTIPAGASFTVPEECMLEIYGAENGYTDFLKIEGSLVNDGIILFPGMNPEDPSAFIEGLRLSGSGFVEISTASGDVGDDINDENTKIYSNNGYLYGGDISNGVTIDENTVKTFYIDELSNNPIFYTPPEGENPAMLEAYGIDHSKAGFECMEDIPVILYIEGDNSFYFDWRSEVLLTGPGSFTGEIATKEFYIDEDFEGELNACVQKSEIIQTDTELNATVHNFIYGSYVQPDYEAPLIEKTEGTGEGITYRLRNTLTVTKGSVYIIYNEDYTAEIIDVGNDYEEYLKIDGEILNNGTIVCSGEIPDDHEAFIRSLNLRGSGTVKFEYEDEGGVVLKTDVYTNDGVKLNYNKGELDFEENTGNDVWGDHLSEYGYSFEEKDGSYVLTLEDFSTPDKVTLPSDKPIVISSTGSCYIGELKISTDNGKKPTLLTFEGDGELTVNKKIWIQDNGTVTIAEGAKVTAKNGFNFCQEDGRLIVNGSLTAIDEMGEHTQAVYVNALEIGSTGILNVSDRRGVWIARNENAAGSLLTIKEGGQLIADCSEYGLIVCSGETIDLNATVSIPEGYLPHEYEFIKSSKENPGTRYDILILALKGSEITATAEGRDITNGKGAEGCIVIHSHSADYDKFIPDPENPDQHIKSCSNDPEHSDSAEAHYGGAATCTKGAVCEACQKEYTEPLGHDFGDWKYAGSGEHTRDCQREGCDSTETEKCSGGAATCTKGAVCDKCHEVYTEPLGHSFGAWKSTGSGEHTRVCQREGCGITETEKCDWTEWAADKEPTETEPGLETRTCKICGGKEERAIPALGTTDPEDPTDPSDPKDPVNPDDPKDPVNPDDPKDPVNPDDPKDPVNPDDPKDPVNPDDPKDPVNPDDPKDPVNPDAPKDPVNPDDPKDPVNPDDPKDPDDPDEPNVPVYSGTIGFTSPDTSSDSSTEAGDSLSEQTTENAGNAENNGNSEAAANAGNSANAGNNGNGAATGNNGDTANNGSTENNGNNGTSPETGSGSADTSDSGSSESGAADTGNTGASGGKDGNPGTGTAAPAVPMMIAAAAAAAVVIYKKKK